MRRTRSTIVTALAVLATAGLLGGCGAGEPERDADTGEIVDASDSDVFTLRVGDCLDSAALGDVVETVPVIPCEEPHDSEVYAFKDLPAGDYPGEDEVSGLADEYCYGEFEGFVRMAYEDSALEYLPMYPLQDGWERLEDRELLCLVVDLDGGVTGSLKGAAR